jgi:hypothetical protein
MMVKLIIESTGEVVHLEDLIQTTLGVAKVVNLHAPRKKKGPGRVTLIINNTKGDYNPAIIGAKWISG